jgi:hypothetical protein
MSVANRADPNDNVFDIVSGGHDEKKSSMTMEGDTSKRQAKRVRYLSFPINDN